jgi:hypothetical protein
MLKVLKRERSLATAGGIGAESVFGLAGKLVTIVFTAEAVSA